MTLTTILELAFWAVCIGVGGAAIGLISEWREDKRRELWHDVPLPRRRR